VSEPRIAIVDYGTGNLFSVGRALERFGLASQVTKDRRRVMEADAVLLPGVGAFGDAMRELRALDLIDPLRERAASGRPLIGICLGMQLLLSRSFEFGEHEGLGIVPGEVRALPRTNTLKLPHVGWVPVEPSPDGAAGWSRTPLEDTPSGTYVYFVHSFAAWPTDVRDTLACARYGDTRFCAAIARGSVIGFQFHPERSGPAGLRIYRELARWIQRQSLRAA
jgi:imidazole glycerol-phosphate synthase subunit HisH